MMNRNYTVVGVMSVLLLGGSLACDSGDAPAYDSGDAPAYDSGDAPAYDSGGDGGSDGGRPCSAATCPQGCCDAVGKCVSQAKQTDTLCGNQGSACINCMASMETDVCLAGACVCMGAGARCPANQLCGQTGCSAACIPDCVDQCAGSPDGCGAPCPAGSCASGCCDVSRNCVPFATQTKAQCGTRGETCEDCGLWGYTCDGTAHTCLSTMTNNASFVSQTVPSVLQVGQSFQAKLTLRNTGTSTWTAATSYRLGAQAPQDNSTWGASRVYLGAQDAITPGQSKTFILQGKAPTSPGVYNFQWRMLREGIAWFGRTSAYQPIVVGSGPVKVCAALRALANTSIDAAATIQGCIDQTSAGDIVELPAGIYQVDGRIRIQGHAITLRTEGMDITKPRCTVTKHACAELRASAKFGDTAGIFQVLAPGSVVDHLVINGNKTVRSGTPSGKQCAGGSNTYGYNMRLACSHCTLTNSVTVGALCGTGCELSGVGDHVIVWRNIIAQNGVHNAQGMWADGLTAHDYSDSTIVANEIYDNTDVDLIFGGCPRCLIADNTLWHSTDSVSGSFAALMLHAWPNGATSGDFKGAITTGNTIDCSSKHRCGFGLYLGADAWYITDTFGGTVHENVVRNAAQGVLIDDVHHMSVWNNPVFNAASSTRASCGTRATTAYGMGKRSHDVDMSLDTLSTTYTPVDWDLCIPNWWK